MKLFMDRSKKAYKKLTTPENYEGKGKQTVKQLVGQGHGVTNIEISDKNIKDFESIARKYGVDFAVVKDATENPPKHLVFLRHEILMPLQRRSKNTLQKQWQNPAKNPHCWVCCVTLWKR